MCGTAQNSFAKKSALKTNTAKINRARSVPIITMIARGFHSPMTLMMSRLSRWPSNSA
jgi:hypothetical protein